jgi:hypothetical protein
LPPAPNRTATPGASRSTLISTRSIADCCEDAGAASAAAMKKHT